MSDYSIFAKHYDTLMGNVNYSHRAEHILKLFKKYDRTPTLMLDLGCGTGGFTREFAKKGISMICVEPSIDMLSIAKAKDSIGDILYLCQSGQEMDLYGTVDGVVCCMDTVNHITDKRDLKAVFSKVSLFLEKDRLFIFDVNTLYKQKKILGDNTFVYETDFVTCVWQNFYDSKRACTDMKLDFFTLNGELYEKSTEYITERVYSKKELSDMLNNAGLKLEAVLGENSFSPPTKTSQRNIYITRKI